MANIPKKIVERFVKSISKYQRILKTAQNRDINEADTVAIIQDILSDVFGFEKYLEITSEFSIRGTYCDLAIKIGEKIQYLIEVKAIGLNLKESFLNQAVNYGANHGAQWVILTNGIEWKLYRIKFERPISHELVYFFNFLDLKPRKKDDQESLYILSKEGIKKSARKDYYERIQCVNKYVISSIIASDPIINLIKKYIKKLSSGIKVDKEEIEKIIKDDVIKRDVIDNEEFTKINPKIRRITKPEKKQKKEKIINNS